MGCLGSLLWLLLELDFWFLTSLLWPNNAFKVVVQKTTKKKAPSPTSLSPVPPPPPPPPPSPSSSPSPSPSPPPPLQPSLSTKSNRYSEKEIVVADDFHVHNDNWLRRLIDTTTEGQDTEIMALENFFMQLIFTFVARQELYGVESMGKSRCHCHRPQHYHYHDFDHNQQPLLLHYEGDI
uniref:Uncharacterized protein n=1 Tax=Glossina austeni TaxID=7395 RepID=A0A1A9V3M5_GLOAU